MRNVPLKQHKCVDKQRLVTFTHINWHGGFLFHTAAALIIVSR